ncbi:MAG: hypothetical protein PHY02_10490 [Phycisphaerae bacterium]|nr:hypothetical protein [Phycisphaerae bacterium]
MPVNSNKKNKAGKGKRIFLSLPVKILILVVCLWLAFTLTGKVLCEIALDQIAELTNTKITTESVDFNINGSVFIKELIIRPKQQNGHDNTILKAKTVYARFGLGSLLLFHPQLKKISVKDFLFDAQHNLDTDQWNIAGFRIKPSKGIARDIPIIRLKRGTFQYSKVSSGHVKAIAAIPIDAEFAPDPKTQDRYSFDMTTADRAELGNSILTGFWEPGRIKITGGISSADIPAFEKAWTINTLDAQLEYDLSNAYSMNLKIEDLQSRNTKTGDIFTADRETFLSKPGIFVALQRFFNRYRPSGTAAIDFQARGNLEQLSASTLIGKVHCKDITILDRRFPYLLKQMTGEIDLTEKKAVLNNLQGRHGDTEVALNGWSEGFGPDCEYEIRITSDNMALDNDLFEALSAKQQKNWSAFSPSGVAAINYKLTRQPQARKKEFLTVKLLGVEAAYHNFPYPLKNLSGTLSFANDSVNVSDVISQQKDCKITLSGKITDYSADRPIYDISVKAMDVPLDSTLASSLSDGSATGKKGDFYARFNMTGFADAEVNIFTPKAHSAEAAAKAEQDAGPISFIADVSLKETSLSCEPLVEKSGDFPLTISDISARTTITPDLIEIKDFTGRYNQIPISLTGRIWPGDGAQKPSYCLKLNTKQTELNDDLISLMPQSLKRIVSELQPKGKVNLSVDFNKTDPALNTGDTSPESRIAYAGPDYKITVDCPGNGINFEPFAYPVENITGRLTITRNTVTLEDITATAIDNTLITSNVSTIKINGRIVLADDAISSDRLKLSEGNISFTADNLRIKGKSLTNLKADTCYDPHRQSWTTENFIADCYGGKVAGKFELKRSAEAAPEYVLQAGFENINLNQFLSEATDSASPGTDPNLYNNQTSGKVSGLLSVASRYGEAFPYIGRCRLQITDMQIGRLSPMAKLLYVLNLTEPKDFAFRQMIVDSYIKHNKLFIEHLDLSGKAVAFNGSGWIDLRSRNANLVLFARGPRLAGDEPSVLQSLTESLGRGVIRMDVTGNVHDSHITTTTLPMVNEAVRILGTPRRKK